MSFIGLFTCSVIHASPYARRWTRKTVMTKPVRIEDEEDVKRTGPESKAPVHSGSFER
jgi:hypothetical protein